MYYTNASIPCRDLSHTIYHQNVVQYPMKERQYFYTWIGFSIAMILLTSLVGALIVRPAFPIDQGSLWYYWRLPEPTIAARITGWIGFLLHLGVTWFLVWKGTQEKQTGLSFSRWNIMLFWAQIIFVLLHLVQTTIWYDSLVYDTPVWLSQVSVIIMLVMMMIILNAKRGLFFGYRFPLPEKAVRFITDIHGYYIILALTFTFWYHPMEATIGHLFGFFYMYLLFAQIIFMNTKTHFQKEWVFILEFFVLVHGTAISLTKNDGMWPMFFFGFAAITVTTQIYLLNLSKNQRRILQLLYLFFALVAYSGLLPFANRSFTKLYELSFIPVTEYGLSIVIPWIIAGIIGIIGIFKRMLIRPPTAD